MAEVESCCVDFVFLVAECPKSLHQKSAELKHLQTKIHNLVLQLQRMGDVDGSAFFPQPILPNLQVLEKSVSVVNVCPLLRVVVQL